VGSNPTFGGQHRVVEAYALDRDDLDLYGVHAAVDFAARLRGMVRFESVDALIAQMRVDVDRARALVAPPAQEPHSTPSAGGTPSAGRAVR
jgi:riboflavin kinase/FMN adenylyltransferase